MPRLLLVAPEAAPPRVVDCLEDWVRTDAPQADVDARLLTLASRAAEGRRAPSLDGDGVLRYAGALVALSPVERALAAALASRFGAVVTRDRLAEAAWPGGLPTRNALDVHMARLRRRLREVGLEIRTVRSRGYLLHAPA